jgi:hypothetical protein
MTAYAELKRVFRLAPWRVQTQAVAAAAVFALVLAALGGLYLATATRAATAGRDVQRLEAEKADLLHELDQLEAEVAALSAVSRMEARAAELGFVPAAGEQVEYLLVANYPTPPPAAKAAAASADLPNYEETLASWVADRLAQWAVTE